MADETEVIKQVNGETEQKAARRARDRARNARWDFNVLIFLFAVLIMVIILATYTKAGLEIVAPIAIFGLSMAWLIGWRRGKQLYQRFYDEELSKLEREVKRAVTETVEETIEERVQKALRERWK
jgi:predicted membrane chloride channel (bestrophin family)